MNDSPHAATIEALEEARQKSIEIRLLIGDTAAAIREMQDTECVRTAGVNLASLADFTANKLFEICDLISDYLKKME